MSAIEAENDENNKFHSSALLGKMDKYEKVFWWSSLKCVIDEENQKNEENQDDNDKE